MAISLDNESAAWDAALAPVLRPYIVTFGNRERPRMVLEVMAPSSSVAMERHEDLAELEERVSVHPVMVDMDAMRREGW